MANIAVLSTIGSSTLNIIGTWKDMNGNSTFKKWQTALSITCAVSKEINSLGEMSNDTTVKTPANRSGTSASSRYKSTYGKASVQKDIWTIYDTLRREWYD